MKTEYDYDYFLYLSQKSAFRRFVRGFYFRAAAALCDGPTLDFGCGTGDFLEYLPGGSIGLEINPHAVRYARSLGRPVELIAESANPRDGIAAHLSPGIRTIAALHVLEHLDDPGSFIREILAMADDNRIENVVFVVPGVKGFRHDATHKTFVTPSLIADAISGSGWTVALARHFPVNVASFGTIFTHNEVQVRLRRSRPTR